MVSILNLDFYPFSHKEYNYVSGQCFKDKVVFLHNDIRYQDSVAVPEYCQAMCYSEFKCKAWSYCKSSKRCFLKTTVGNDITTNDDFISGPKSCTGKFCHTNCNFNNRG